MSDRTLLIQIQRQLTTIARQLGEVQSRTAAGARGDALFRARTLVGDAALELPFVLSGALDGDGTTPAPRFIGLDTARHTRAGEATR